MELSDQAQDESFAWAEQLPLSLKQRMDEHTLQLFERQWERLLDGYGFYVIPYSEDTIKEMKAAHFWHNIINEICETADYSLKRLVDETGASYDFISQLSLCETSGHQMSVDVGGHLLELHNKLRPDCYPGYSVAS